MATNSLTDSRILSTKLKDLPTKTTVPILQADGLGLETTKPGGRTVDEGGVCETVVGWHFCGGVGF